jgi:phage-related baseplate assembly protein
VRTVLVVANETLGGAPLLEAVRRRVGDGDVRFHLVVPASRPRRGNVIYLDAVRDAAQVRIALATQYLANEFPNVAVDGEVGDEDPFAATIDAAAELEPSEIIISTLPATSSGWMRRDLIERVHEATGLPVEHVVMDTTNQRLVVDVTLVVASQTAGGPELVERLRALDAENPDRPRHFIILVPLPDGTGNGTQIGRERLDGALEALHNAGLTSAGTLGDPDPYTAIMNALQVFPNVDDIVISTLPGERSGWLRADLVARVRRATGLPVDHVVVNLTESAA